MKSVTIIGGGPGQASYLLPIALETARQCDTLIADRRVKETLEQAGLNNVREMGTVMSAVEDIKNMDENSRLALFVSGDPAYYSMYRLIRRTCPDVSVEYIPGISSIQVIASRAGVTLEDAAVFSGHGKALPMGQLCGDVREKEAVFVLCDKDRNPSWLARKLVEGGLSHVTMWAGSRLTYPDEIVMQGPPESFIGKDFPPLTVVCVKDEKKTGEEDALLLRDDRFERNETPMTRETVRWAAIGRLGLKPSSVLWDIGAGTGSVSLEAARICKKGQVISFEKDPRALDVLKANKKKFAAVNMRVVPGDAADGVKDPSLPRPTHVFLGGTGRKLESIMGSVKEPGTHVMIACVTMETTARALAYFCPDNGFRDVDIVTIQTEQARSVGSYHVMEAGHRVTLLSAIVADRQKTC